jgi:prophage antirepressor-like protein
MKDNFNVFSSWEKTGVMVLVDGEPWFVASMVAAMLGYDSGTDVAALFGNVPDECKDIKRVPNPHGTPDAFCISEQGLYDFILSSERPEARPFQKMVFEVVLPSIFKHGAYMNDDLIGRILENSGTVTESIEAFKESEQYNTSRP